MTDLPSMPDQIDMYGKMFSDNVLLLFCPCSADMGTHIHLLTSPFFTKPGHTNMKPTGRNKIDLHSIYQKVEEINPFLYRVVLPALLKQQQLYIKTVQNFIVLFWSIGRTVAKGLYDVR